MNVASLIALGYQVNVTHVRDCGKFAALVPTPKDNGMVTQKDKYLTKKEFYTYLKQNRIVYQPEPNGMMYNPTRDTVFGSAVRANGGFTMVELIAPNGTKYAAKHNFGRHRFQKSIGVAACLGKLNAQYTL